MRVRMRAPGAPDLGAFAKAVTTVTTIIPAASLGMLPGYRVLLQLLLGPHKSLQEVGITILSVSERIKWRLGQVNNCYL